LPPARSKHALALAFGVLIVFLVVAGSLWIMSDLNGAMMPAMSAHGHAGMH
jgi:cytochrome o ubiquinol oxidase subunit IV